MYEELAYGVLIILLGTFLNLFIMKRMLSDDKIMEKIELILNNMVNDVEMQRKVYLMGTLLGSGIAKGSGIARGSGKINLESIIAEGASAFIGQMFKQKEGIPSQGALP